MIIGNFFNKFNLKTVLNSDFLGLALRKINEKLNLFLILLFSFTLSLIFTTNSIAQNIQDQNAKTNGGSISDIINKMVTENGDNDVTKNNQDSGKSLSKIISSLVNKGDDSSIMFSEDEITKIYQALDAHKNNQPFDVAPKEIEEKEQNQLTKDNTDSCIYLGSILYHSPDNWSAWINGQKISSSNNQPTNELYIKSINPTSANIVWSMSISKWKILANQTSDTGAPINANNQVELNFNLSFNQTYMLVGGKIIEGKITSLSSTIKTGLETSKNTSKYLEDSKEKAIENP